MAAITDMVLTISGILTFSNGEKHTVEACYDHKADTYCPSRISGLGEGYWLYSISKIAIESMTGVSIGAGPSFPAVVTIDPNRTLTLDGGILHIRGILTKDDNTNWPLSATLDFAHDDIIIHTSGVPEWYEILTRGINQIVDI